MKAKNAIPKAVLAQFRAWGRLGGLASKKKLTQLQRKTISVKAATESARVRRNGNGG